MAEIRNFQELIVWQKAHRLFLDTVGDVQQFNNVRACTVIADQLLRAASSISANIAEGFGRHRGREYVHYLIVARGSTTESMNWYINCRDLKMVNDGIFQTRYTQLEEIMKMFNKMVSQQRSRDRR
jgi:four helix bundle protein